MRRGSESGSLTLLSPYDSRIGDDARLNDRINREHSGERNRELESDVGEDAECE
ncbi:hypothetical protein [Haladaptatus pallidirubidus]|uniref:hypothetical protein n=1 Tax=Haladaptatus pallidirubidus TaxID=1008152 RepID=UPI0036F22101